MTALAVDLYGDQYPFVTTDAHYAAVFGGIGSGKSYSGAVRGIMAAMGTIGSQAVPVPNLGQVTAPTYKLLKDATLRTYLDVGGDLIAQFNKSDQIMTMVNGSEILFRTADNPELLRGPNLLWWHGDEAALCHPDMWPIMIGRLRQYGEHGWAWLTTTPKGRNWCWREFVRDFRADFARWTLPTMGNPFLSAQFVESLQSSYVGDFAAQELGGEFIAFEGLIYAEFDRRHHVQRTRPDRFERCIGGVDWGFANPGVLGIGGVDSDQRLYLVGEHYQRLRRVEEWAQVAKQEQDTWNVETWYCDPSEPDYIEIFRKAGVRAEPANNSVNPGIQAVKNRLVVLGDGMPRLVIAPDCVNTIAEFESYVWAENRYGMRDQPVKANDHAMDMLRYMVMGLDTFVDPISEISYADQYSISSSPY